MGERLTQAAKGTKAFWICLSVAIALIVGGALTPPPFVIDSSIFIASGELFGFAALATLNKALDKGVDAKIEKGDTKISIDNKTDDEV